MDANKRDDKEILISLSMPGKVNKLLTEAAARSGRSKVKEAVLRLADHLQHFPDIATTGKRFGKDDHKD